LKGLKLDGGSALKERGFKPRHKPPKSTAPLQLLKKL